MEPYSDLSAIGEAAEAEVKVVAVGALDPQPGDVLLAVVARVPDVQYQRYNKSRSDFRSSPGTFLTSGTTQTLPTPPLA